MIHTTFFAKNEVVLKSKDAGIFVPRKSDIVILFDIHYIVEAVHLDYSDNPFIIHVFLEEKK